MYRLRPYLAQSHLSPTTALTPKGDHLLTSSFHLFHGVVYNAMPLSVPAEQRGLEDEPTCLGKRNT